MNVSSYKKQKGTILITVMLLFAIGAYMATEITYRQKVDIQRTFSIVSQSQAYEYVLASEEIAKFALRRDLKGDKDKEKIRDHEKEDWGTPLSYALDGGTIEGQVKDLQGRFNLNWLRESDEGRRNKVKAALVNLLGQLKIPKETPAQTVADQIADLVDGDDTPTGDGKEDNEYMLENLPRRAGNKILIDVSELLLVPALTLEEIEILAPFVAVLPRNSGLNVNTATSEVLSSFECVDVNGIESGRPEDKGYDDLANVTIFKTDDSCDKAKDESPIEYTISSEFFELEAKSVINGKTIKVRSAIYRNADQDSNIDVKVIYRKQVDPYSSV